jgi:hypothetical protein
MNAKGTGLGLSICKNIIEQLGGTVSIESEEGLGTKFHITISLKVEEKHEYKSNYSSSLRNLTNKKLLKSKKTNQVDLSSNFGTLFKKLNPDSNFTNSTSNRNSILEFQFNSLLEQQKICVKTED